MNRNEYLARIHYPGTPSVTFNSLAELQHCHMRAVPFENLAIHYQQPILLNEDRLFRKIVGNRRGGFCYELNGLFAQLLQEIGFTVTLISAEVCQSDGTFGPAFDHLALLVELDDVFLVDVGFGDSFIRPLRLQQRGSQMQGTTAYLIRQEGDTYVLHHKKLAEPGADWKPHYRFTRQARQLADFSPMCHYHQTSPESHFTHKRVCSRATVEGRVTFSDQRLVVTQGASRTETILESEAEFSQALQAHFSIRI
ncbi:N-hydroxyarylamine O-acetyltransferase [Hymenobacter gelipurpurascens]|uniref:N-hydroxyarylamine O-acetyltransferase n=1 Tax=Hymenobacter gelipurpurascens TaxID=89968 RepID=A0A212UH01_9BACT|nr:arylamine N-acetyltransferase [Hymenobacter gelipurpurascens]SNC77539.1 N-hydroxyarylamine O-acetyltransferase [Hymenobacter gelipurpurascens]